MGLRRWITDRTSSPAPDFGALVQIQLGSDGLVGMVAAMNQAADASSQLFAAGMNALDAGGRDRSPIGGDATSTAQSIPRVSGRLDLIAVSERRVTWFVVSNGEPKGIATVPRAAVTLTRTGGGQTGYAEVRFAFEDGSFVLYLCSTADSAAGFWELVG